MELAEVALLNGATRAEVLRLAGAVEARVRASDRAGGRRRRARRGRRRCRRSTRLPQRAGRRRRRRRRRPRGRGRPQRRHDHGRLGRARARATLDVRDTVKPTSAEADRASSKELGLTPVLLTGDAAQTAERVAGEVGIERVLAEVYPDDKVRRGHAAAGGGRGRRDGRRRRQRRARARPGRPRPRDRHRHRRRDRGVRPDARLRRPARRRRRDPRSRGRTLRTIKGNLFWAFAYNVAAIPLAVAGLLNPIVAAAAMAASSLFVVTNSLRLRRFRSAREGVPT